MTNASNHYLPNVCKFVWYLFHFIQFSDRSDISYNVVCRCLFSALTVRFLAKKVIENYSSELDLNTLFTTISCFCLRLWHLGVHVNIACMKKGLGICNSLYVNTQSSEKSSETKNGSWITSTLSKCTWHAR